jgi:uncharacterized membrane protein YhhN
MITATVICALAVVALVAGEIRSDPRLHRFGKPVASGAFLTVALLAADLSTPIELAIVIAQGLGVVGDLALMRSRAPGLTGKRWFAYGLLAFLAGHLTFIVGFSTVLSPLRWARIAGWPMLGPIYIAIKTTRGIWPKLSSTLKKLVPIYVTVITVMVIGAIALASHGAWPGRIRLWWGALLFFVSDVAVAQDLASEPGDTSNRIWGLPCYYAGQLLIAWSLAAE